MSNTYDTHQPCTCTLCQPQQTTNRARRCRVCAADTPVIVNINLKAAHVCNECCLSITRQTVQSLTVRSLEVPFE